MQYPIPSQRAGFRTLQISTPPTWHISRRRRMHAIDNRSIVDRLRRFFIIALYGNSHGHSNRNSNRELPRNEWLMNGLPKKLPEKCQISCALKILIHSILGWPELVSPNARRAHKLEYTHQADHCSFNNLADVFLRLFGMCCAYFPVCSGY